MIILTTLVPALIFGAIILALAVIIGIIAIIVAIVRKLLSNQKESGSGESARLLREMNAKLGKLENRIETLETIVTDGERRPSA